MVSHRRRFLATAAAAAVGAFAGCVGSALEDGDDPTNAAEENVRANDDGTIEVDASGSAETEPDRAVVQVGVEARGDSAEAVRTELAAGAEDLRATFDDLGIPEENVRTATFRIGERRERSGFEGIHAFSVEVDDVERVGEVVDASVAAGADDVGRVTFTLQDETRERLRGEALDAALANADAEAEQIAANRGVEIVGTRAVSTTDGDVRPLQFDAATEAASDDAGPPTELVSGPVTVTATVRVVYGFSREE